MSAPRGIGAEPGWHTAAVRFVPVHHFGVFVLLPALALTACGVDTPGPSRAVDQALAMGADRAAVALDADRVQQRRELSAARAVAQQRSRTTVAAARQQAERAAAEAVAEAAGLEAARLEAERVAAQRAAGAEAERAARAQQAAAPRAAAPPAAAPRASRSDRAPAAAPPPAAPASAAAPQAAAAPAWTSSAYSAEVLRLVNVERSRVGMSTLAASGCAGSWATRWSQRMADTGDFSHQRLEPVLEDCRAKGVGENIGFGNSTPAEMMQLWMDSPGHRENILRPQFTRLGVGAVQRADGRWYVTQDFLVL